MSPQDPEPPLEGEILAPGTRYQQETLRLRVVRLGWFGRLMLAFAGLAFMALALFVTFWVLVLLIPAVAIWLLASRLWHWRG